MTTRRAALPLSLALLLSARLAGAITVDGQLDPAYGTALVTQTTQTGLNSGQITGDSNLGDLNFANGSELDHGYALVSDGVLHLFLTGNLALVLNVNQNRTNGHVLDVFVDSGPGGQNTLNGIGTGHPLNGLTFDAGFDADHWFEFSGDGNLSSVEWYAAYSALPTGSGGSLTSLGVGSAGGNGTLVGGTNPFGVLATIDNRNTAGVTFGCDAASGAGATLGVEWAIPLAAIGNPTDCIRLAVIVRTGGGSTSSLSNSVLAPVPPGTCPLGPAAFVNFAGIAGNQFVTVCPSATGVPFTESGRFDLSLAGPNPGRGDQLRLAFELPDARPATLRLFDCAGRVVREQLVSAPAGGFGTADLSAGPRLAPGLYWARLSQGPARVVRRLCVVR